MNTGPYNGEFIQSVITGLQVCVHQLLEKHPSYITVTFASWPNKALIYMDYYLRGWDKCAIAVKLYNHPQVLHDIKLFVSSFAVLQTLCPRENGMKYRITTIDLTSISTKYPLWGREIRSGVNPELSVRPCPHYRLQNWCTFQGHVVCIQGPEILVYF